MSLTDPQRQGPDPQRLYGRTTTTQTAAYAWSKTIDRIRPVAFDSAHLEL